MEEDDQKGPSVGEPNEVAQPDAIMGENDDDGDSSSSGFNDDDPRLQLLFSQEPPSRPYQASEYDPPEEEPPALDIDEHAILNCWEWSVQQHGQTNIASAWVAPNEDDGAFDDAPEDATENPYRSTAAVASLAHWEPPSLHLPTWAIANVPNNDENA